jgi:putative ABC transport system permease protein
MSETLLPLPLQKAPGGPGAFAPRASLGPGARRSFARFFRELREAQVQSIRSLLAHKLRAALTIAGITIGVGTVTAIFSATAGLDQSFAKQLSSLGPNTLYVSKWAWFSNDNNWWKYRNRPVIGRGDWSALRANANLPLAIAPMAGTLASVSLGDKVLKNIEARGTVEAFLETGGWQVRRGRFISNIDDELGTDACVIGADLEDAFFKNRDPLGSQLTVGPYARCTVVGTLVRKGNAFGRSQDTLVVLPLSAFLRSFGQKRGLTIAVVAPASRMLETEEEIIQVLRTARRISPDQEENFSVNRQDKMLQNFDQITKGMKAVALLVGIITVIVGGIGIMNILLVSVKERTREIGVRRALGARRTTILLQFLCEAITVSFVGSALGTLLGISVAWILAQVTPMNAAVTPQMAGLGLAFAVLTGLVFGLWPALSAALLHPIEALRYE